MYLNIKLKNSVYLINFKNKFIFGIFLFDFVLYQWKRFRFLNADLRFFFKFSNIEKLLIIERLKQSGIIFIN